MENLCTIVSAKIVLPSASWHTTRLRRGGMCWADYSLKKRFADIQSLVLEKVHIHLGDMILLHISVYLLSMTNSTLGSPIMRLIWKIGLPTSRSFLCISIHGCWREYLWVIPGTGSKLSTENLFHWKIFALGTLSMRSMHAASKHQ